RQKQVFPASANRRMMTIRLQTKSIVELRGLFIAALSFIALISGTNLLAQGPPFQVDDPVPVDFRHYEFYIFGAADGTPVLMSSVGPAFEFNWGAVPRVQLHAILPWGGAFPSNKAVYAPA